MSSDFFESLNPYQHEAATFDLTWNLMILAPPGSGKTMTLAYRVAYLISQGISPSRILLLTFTNKAAAELKNRIRLITSNSSEGITVGTFHYYGLKILRKHCAKVELKFNFVVATGKNHRETLLSALSKFLKQHSLDELKGVEPIPEEETFELENFREEDPILHISTEEIKNIISIISRSKIDPQYFCELPHEFKKFIHIYNQELRGKNQIDFSDMLYLSTYILKVHRDVLRTYQDSFDHILVDEFQDCNPLQIEFLKMMQLKSKFTVCGDEDQSIYGWLGISNKIFQEFQSNYQAKTVVLRQNYRSTPEIIEKFTNLIQFNVERTEKEIITSNESGPAVQVNSCSHWKEEARMVVFNINKLVKEQQLKYSEIAILYRINAIYHEISFFLKNLGLPIKKTKGNYVLDKTDSKIVCYVKFAMNTKDKEAFINIINFPKRGIGKKQLEKLDPDNYYDSISSNLSNKKFKKFYDIIQSIISVITEYSPKELILMLLDLLGLKSENLVRISEKYTESGLNQFIDFLSEFGEADGLSDCVTISNIHQAKGREWKAVFLVRFNEGILPLKKQDLREERRIAYVALSRSQRFLFVTYLTKSGPSNFIVEMKEGKKNGNNQMANIEINQLGNHEVCNNQNNTAKRWPEHDSASLKMLKQ